MQNPQVGETDMNKPNTRLTRDIKHARIAGVCAGIARHFSLETWVVRIITFGALFFSGSLILFAYIAAWLILEPDNKPDDRRDSNSYGQNNFGYDDYHFDIKENTWRSGEPPKQALVTIANGYQKLEQRIQQMEKHVTSQRFQVEREINKL